MTWTPPPDTPTGYVVYLEPGGVEESVSADSTSHRFEGLQSGTDYLVSLVALSAQLPSLVVGPVAPSSESLFSLSLSLTNYLSTIDLSAPTVSLSTTTNDPNFGGDITFLCQVELPDGIEVTENPHVEFFGPGEEGERGPFLPIAIIPIGGSFLATYTFDDVDLFSGGTYRCTATYSIGDSTSPPGEGSLDVDVTCEFMKLGDFVPSLSVSLCLQLIFQSLLLQ